MVKVNILPHLERLGKTKYWLYKQLGMSYRNFNNMITNETKSIRYENLELLCNIFECAPNDLFVYIDEETGKVSRLEDVFAK